MKRLLSVFLALVIFGCALPRDLSSGQKFVSERELDAVSYARQGVEFLRTSKFVDAEFAFRQSLYIYPQAPNVKANLATALTYNGQYYEAEDILEHLIAEYPEVLDYRESLGRLHLEQGNFLAARKEFGLVFEKAVKKGDLIIASRTTRSQAVISFRMGEEEDAICASGLAFSFKSDPPELLRHIRLILGANQVRRAIALLTLRMSEGPFNLDPALGVQLAMAHFADQDFVQAEAVRKFAEDLSTKDPSIISELKLLEICLKLALDPSSSGSDNDIKLAKNILNSLGAGSIYWPTRYYDFVSHLSKSDTPEINN